MYQLLFCCSGGVIALKPAYHSNCETTVEATYTAMVNGLAIYPAIVVRDDGRELTYTGKLIAVEENGIRFDPKRKGFFANKPVR